MTPEAAPNNNKSAHRKAGKKLLKLINRTFSKHHKAPERLTEQDALLRYITCPPPIQTNDSSSVATSTSNFTDAHDNWRKLREIGVLQHTRQQDTDDDSTINESPIDRAQRIQKAQDQIRQAMSVPLWQCLLAIGVYIALTVICFSDWLEDDWSLLDSSYFAVVTFTTIGYGDVVPDSPKARWFTCFWALSGVASLGIALGVLGSNLIVVHEQHMEKAQVSRQDRVIGLFEDQDDDDSIAGRYSTTEESRLRNMFDGMDDSEDGTNQRARQPRQEESRCRTITATLIRSLLLGGYISGVLYLISKQEGWDLSKTIYYGLITASTVGYGDIAPQSDTGRFLAILFIPVAVGIMGTFLEKVANLIIDYRREQYTQELHNKPLTLEQIRILDTDGDGEVSMMEFMEFMLVAMNQVDQSLLDQLKEHFQRLDVDGSGTINKADLAQMAQKRMLNRGEKSARSQYNLQAQQQGTNYQATSPTTSGLSNVQKPSLQREATQQTSNRSFETGASAWSSYHNPPTPR